MAYLKRIRLNYYMNSLSFKKITIILFILLLISIAGIIIAQIYLKNNTIKIENGEGGTDIFENYGKASNGGVNSDAYFDIKKCMQEYLNTLNIYSSRYGYYKDSGEYVPTVNESEIKQKIYNLLSDKYIKEKNITIENINNHINIFKDVAIFVPVELTMIQDEEIKSFLVYGLIESRENYNVINKIFAVVNIDIVGGKFSIEPIEGEYNSINEINIDKLEEYITDKGNNEFYQEFIEAEDILAEYIKQYKGLAMGAPEKLYNLLDEEYRNARFGSLDEFKKYIQENKAQIITAQVEKYQVEVDINKVRYVCIDGNENYYVINQNEALNDYTIMLDTYTIDLKEFKEKYDSSENNLKVALNIQKLIQATKAEDYKYVYSKLNDTFKSNNFKTQEQFEKYIEEKYDAQNDEIEYENYEENAGVHVYNIKVTKKKENKIINAKIVMKLKENRGFELSFSIEN